MKQTAVEWLAENIDNLIPYVNDESAKKFNELVEQAKEMEKQQQGYSEEEVIEILLNCRGENPRYIEEWFEQFKKK